MTKLTAKRVEEIFMDCLFKEAEEKVNFVEAEGVLGSRFGFHPERLESHRDEIVELLYELPKNFRERDGGGWSFLQACDDRHGNQWTGMHLTMEQLFVLGIAIKRVKYLLPRDMWCALPGQMPYLAILEEKEEPCTTISN